MVLDHLLSARGFFLVYLLALFLSMFLVYGLPQAFSNPKCSKEPDRFNQNLKTHR